MPVARRVQWRPEPARRRSRGDLAFPLRRLLPKRSYASPGASQPGDPCRRGVGRTSRSTCEPADQPCSPRFLRLSAPAPGCSCVHGCRAGRSACRLVTRAAAPRLTRRRSHGRSFQAKAECARATLGAPDGLIESPPATIRRPLPAAHRPERPWPSLGASLWAQLRGDVSAARRSWATTISQSCKEVVSSSSWVMAPSRAKDAAAASAANRSSGIRPGSWS